MAGLGEKFRGLFSVNYDDDYDDDFDEDFDDEYDQEVPEVSEPEEEPKASSRKSRMSAAAAAEDYDDEEDDDDFASSRSSFRQSRAARGQSKAKSSNSRVVSISHSPFEVVVIRPKSVEASREIIDIVNSGRAATINLEGLKADVAQRIVDHVMGGVYAIDGYFQTIGHMVYIVTPRHGKISGDLTYGTATASPVNRFSAAYSRSTGQGTGSSLYE